MIWVYADGQLVYNSRLDEYKLLRLKTTTGLNKSGTAELILPPGHPAYNAFISYRTVVTLYEGEKLRFRGRALYHADDFGNNRTITCEGERGFFQDAVIRPYLYQDSPATIFAAALELYNASVDEFKRFTLGTVTVTDANDYVRLESSEAETFAAFFDKLVDRCGGYITFSDDGNGGRAVNWLAEVGTESNQPIEFGENLLEFARSGQSPDLATAIYPRGAQLEDGSRVTIASVTEDGADWIEDTAAVALRGRITSTQTWDDVTEPSNLLTKARQWLNEHKLAITSLQLTAVDLSRYDRTLDTYTEGDLVPVKSEPHGIDELFQLTDRTIDWLNPDGGSITLGKTYATLTGADVMLEQDTKAARTIIFNAIVNNRQQIQEVSRSLTSKIEQTSTSILLEVSQKYTTKNELGTQVQSLTSKIEQLAGSISLEVSGGLGNTAAIRLSVDGVPQTESLDLSNVRQAFAGDTSAVTISAGTITFESGTLVVNSANFKVDATGKITATGAEISGALTAESGVYKSKITGGYYEMYYDGELCGRISSDYIWGSSGKGITITVDGIGKYLKFQSIRPDNGQYQIDYYLNCGYSSNYSERHIFQSSARFLSKLYWSNAYARALYMYENTYIKACDDDGTATEEMLGFNGSMVNVGSAGCPTMLRGTTVYLKNTSTTVTSDRNAKNSIEALPDAYEAFIDQLDPVRFKYNGGTSGRYHVGFVAQDVAAALEAAGLSTQDFAGYVNVEPAGELGLAYDEFIALLLMKIKRLEQRVAALPGAQ